MTRSAGRDGHGSNRAIGILALILVATLDWVSPVVAQPEHAARMKAALVSNFLLFSSARGETKEPQESVLRLVVLGHHESDPDFASIDGKPIGGAILQVHRSATVEDVPECDLVFVSRIFANELDSTIAAVKAPGVLTVSELDGFCRSGGAIRIFVSRNRLAFEVSLDAVEQADLELSSRMLRIAQLYDPDRDGD